VIDDLAINIISNTFNEHSVAYQQNHNPIDKIIQLYNEKIELYERLLKTEQEKNSQLEKNIERKATIMGIHFVLLSTCTTFTEKMNVGGVSEKK